MLSKLQKLWLNHNHRPSNKLDMIALRFLQVFREHGVEIAQVPRLLPAIKIANLASNEALLTALTPEILDETARLFNVRIEWLEGVDDTIMCETRFCYKAPHFLLEHLTAIAQRENAFDLSPLRILTTSKELDRGSDKEQLLIPVLVEKLAQWGDEAVYRYHVYHDHLDWRNPTARIELKALARIAFARFRNPVPLYQVSPAEAQLVMAGKVIPMKFLSGSIITDPSLEDYASSPESSVVAKEVDELPAVLSYIEEHDLSRFSLRHPQTTAATDEPITLSRHAKKAAQTKHAPMNAIKADFIDAFERVPDRQINRTALAREFFDSLEDKKKLLFDNRDAAIRTLTTALREHLRGSSPSS